MTATGGRLRHGPTVDRFAADVGPEGPVAVAGGRTRWHSGGEPVGEPRFVTAPAGIVEYKPDEMTIRIAAGTSVAELDAALGEHGQRSALSDRGGTVGGAVAVGENDRDVLSRGRCQGRRTPGHLRVVGGKDRLRRRSHRQERVRVRHSPPHGRFARHARVSGRGHSEDQSHSCGQSLVRDSGRPLCRVRRTTRTRRHPVGRHHHLHAPRGARARRRWRNWPGHRISGPRSRSSRRRNSPVLIAGRSPRPNCGAWVT